MRGDARRDFHRALERMVLAQPGVVIGIEIEDDPGLARSDGVELLDDQPPVPRRAAPVNMARVVAAAVIPGLAE